VTVLVDPLRDYPDAGLALRLWCHMVSDAGFDELHDFARRLGIPRRRFQGDHYDLHAELRARAVALGAVEVQSGELVRRMAGPRGDRARARREARSVQRQPVDLAPRVPDPGHDDQHGEDRAGDDEHQRGGHADEPDGDPDGQQHRLDARPGEMDLLSGGRDLWLERRHEM
jgi:hypothetical protein